MVTVTARGEGVSARVWLALPVYNEEHALPLLLDRIANLSLHSFPLAGIIVVDDGSSDASAAVLAQSSGRLPIQVLSHDVNQGLGETIQDALRAAAREAGPADVVVTMDADNTHPPELIPRLLEAIEAGSDVVVASRYGATARVSGLSVFRLSMSWGARFLYQLLAPMQNVRDYTCGFRAYRAGVLREVLARHAGRLSEERGFAAMAEILIRFGAAGARISEVPFELRYELKGGASKMDVSATVRRTARVAWRNRFRGQPESRPRQPRAQAHQPAPPQ
jgi:dolichol-phosphate mannosyltransferase